MNDVKSTAGIGPADGADAAPVHPGPDRSATSRTGASPSPTSAPATADTAPTGLRTLKKSRTREAMHRAAVELVAEHGSAKVTVEMIAEAADVSPRTFFNYWDSKDAAVLGLTPDRNGLAVELLRERPADERPEASLRAVVMQMAALMPEDPSLRRAKRVAMDREPNLRLMSGRTMAHLQEGLVDVLEERMAGDDARDRATVLVQLAFAVAHSAFALSFTHGTPVREEFEHVYRLIDDGDVGI